MRPCTRNHSGIGLAPLIRTTVRPPSRERTVTSDSPSISMACPARQVPFIRTSHSRSTTGFTKSISTGRPEPGFLPVTRAGRTRVSFTTMRSPGSRRSTRSAIRRCMMACWCGFSTRSLACSRGSVGSVATSEGSKGKSKSDSCIDLEFSIHARTVLRRRRDRWLGEGHFLQFGAGVIVGQNGGERIAELGQLLRAPLTHADGMARPIA